MTKEFNQIEQLEEMNLKWLLSNGWTIKSNLAYREILHYYDPSLGIKEELIEETILKYELEFSEIERIKEALSEFVEVINSIQAIILKFT